MGLVKPSNAAINNNSKKESSPIKQKKEDAAVSSLTRYGKLELETHRVTETRSDRPDTYQNQTGGSNR